jgi:Cu(I)/Ag(I) efflux system membrane fusion protein
MNKKTIIMSVIICLLIISNGLMIYYFIFNKDNVKDSANQAELYICPMHPQIQQAHPGICPICNMELVLKGSNEEMEGMTSETPDEKLREIALSPSQQVLANVQTQVAELGEFDFSIEANGVVKLRDDASGQISSPVKGKITKLYINYEGQRVSKGEKAFELYSPELIATQREFLLAYENFLKAQESAISGLKESAESVLNASKQRLLLWFVDESQINELMETRNVLNSLTYYSDFSGVVTKKYFNEGSWVMEGNTILDVVNLSSVWIMANVYENEISRIKKGQTADITVGGYPNEMIRGRIDYINPIVNSDTRTIEVRITTPNSNMILKPGMFVKVSIQAEKESKYIVVPNTAVLRSGKTDLVYVKRSDNIFAPRRVITGGEQNGRVLIKSGLDPGENIVVSAGFLIDSESQIRLGGKNEPQNMPGMDMPENEGDVQIKEGDALKDMKEHKH